MALLHVVRKICSSALGSDAAALRDIVEVLVKCPDAATERDRKGMLPLHVAAARPVISVDVVNAIFTAYPDAVYDACSGKLPLHFAVEYGASVGVVKFLLYANQAAAAVPDSENRTPLHLCFVPGPLCEHAVVLALLAACPIAASMKSSRTVRQAIPFIEHEPPSFLPLHLASISGASRDVADLLITANPSAISERTGKGMTPLHFSAQLGTEAVALAILERLPASSSLRCGNGRLPLYYLLDSMMCPSLMTGHRKARLPLSIPHTQPVLRALLAAYPAGLIELPCHLRDRLPSISAVVAILQDAALARRLPAVRAWALGRRSRRHVRVRDS